MATFITDPSIEEFLHEQLAATRDDRYDEVWEGITMMTPAPNSSHQGLVARLVTVIQMTLGLDSHAEVYPGVNVSDRDDWTKNFRCPDVAVYLPETTASLRDSHWVGGPDFAVEICSPYDRTREKFDFYAKVATRELLIVDRDPWQLELYQLQDGKLVCVGKSNLAEPAWLKSGVLPLEMQLVASEKRPQIFVRRTDGQPGQWRV